MILSMIFLLIHDDILPDIDSQVKNVFLQHPCLVYEDLGEQTHSSCFTYNIQFLLSSLFTNVSKKSMPKLKWRLKY